MVESSKNGLPIASRYVTLVLLDRLESHSPSTVQVPDIFQSGRICRKMYVPKYSPASRNSALRRVAVALLRALA